MTPEPPSGRQLAWILLLTAAAYMIPFVDRGWIPHDEGMIGQSAERVLQGHLPHVDYSEPYTGGLSWMYAAAFRVFGVDLVVVRWLLYAATLPMLLILHDILRRALGSRGVGAALGVWLAVSWSLPNYFAGLPSWWVLIFALLALWAIIRYIESSQLEYVVLSGLAVGVAITIKQTAVYLLPPVLMTIWASSGKQADAGETAAGTAIRTLVGLGLATVAILIMRARLLPGEVVYLFVPVAASSLAFVLAKWSDQPTCVPSIRRALSLLALSVTAPFAFLSIPYVASGHLYDLIHGAFILPGMRLDFASVPMPPPLNIVAGVAIATAMVWTPMSLTSLEVRALLIIRSVVGIAVVVWSLSNNQVLHFLLQSLRGIGALLPVLGAWLVTTGSLNGSLRRRQMFAVSAMLAWASLIQFPYGTFIYFCYVAPLAVISMGFATGSSNSIPRSGLGPFAVAVLLLPLLTVNRGYLGEFHSVPRQDTPLGLARADLTVSREDAATYRRTVELVEAHIAGGRLVAGPDCPEIYFLAGQFSPTGSIFDFFDLGRLSRQNSVESAWLNASVVVINHHPGFSPTMPESFSAVLRRQFPHAEQVGRFEVRWR